MKKERKGRTLRKDSHFSWQRKENGPSSGIAVGISRGRDMNVFSMISAVICTSEIAQSKKGDGGELTSCGLR